MLILRERLGPGRGEGRIPDRHPDPNDFARVQSDNPSGANSTKLWVVDVYCNPADALSSDCIVFRSEHVSP